METEIKIATRATVLIKIVLSESLEFGLGVTFEFEPLELLEGDGGKGAKLVQVDRLQSVKLS